MIVQIYIGDNPDPQPDNFELMDSKDASALIEGAMATSHVGDTLHVVAVAVEEGP